MASQRQFVLLALALVVATAFVARPVRAVCEDPDGDGVVSDDGVLPMCNGGVDLDPFPADNTQCGSLTSDDTCDDCSITGPLGYPSPTEDGTDTDGDGECDESDDDDDGDTVLDGPDPFPTDKYLCGDTDTDGCDDCSVTGGPPNTDDDGDDFDGTEGCDFSDPDDDNDTVLDEDDPYPKDPMRCGDTDSDGCDDCSVTGLPDPANDGTDTDGNGICDFSDNDDDGDGAPDVDDTAPLDKFVCGDSDFDTCDDCVSGTRDSTDDGTDTDGDNLCDDGDDDDDNDGVDDMMDESPLINTLCTDDDLDTCNDCVSGTYDPANDGPDLDGDGLCDSGDDDADGDGVTSGGGDPNDMNADVCGDGTLLTLMDMCDDCGANQDYDMDGDELCDEFDPDRDGDTVDNGVDEAPDNAFLCSDDDLDNCDDCSSGTYETADDGLDTDSDTFCDAGDDDADGDGVDSIAAGGLDPDDLDASVCGDTDTNMCDDCDTVNNGEDLDIDGICDLFDDDADGDGVLAYGNLDGIDDPDDLDNTVCGDHDGDQCDDCAFSTVDLRSDSICEPSDPSVNTIGVPGGATFDFDEADAFGDDCADGQTYVIPVAGGNTVLNYDADPGLTDIFLYEPTSCAFLAACTDTLSCIAVAPCMTADSDAVFVDAAGDTPTRVTYAILTETGANMRLFTVLFVANAKQAIAAFADLDDVDACVRRSIDATLETTEFSFEIDSGAGVDVDDLVDTVCLVAQLSDSLAQVDSASELAATVGFSILSSGEFPISFEAAAQCVFDQVGSVFGATTGAFESETDDGAFFWAFTDAVSTAVATTISASCVACNGGAGMTVSVTFENGYESLVGGSLARPVRGFVSFRPIGYNPTLDNGFGFAGVFIDVDVFDQVLATKGNKLTALNDLITITFERPANLPAYDEDEGTLGTLFSVMYLHVPSGEWRSDGVSIECDAAECIITTTHLSTFAVVADPCAAAYTDCGSCLADPACGWCNRASDDADPMLPGYRTGICVLGDESGPAQGSFAFGWDYAEGTCECFDMPTFGGELAPSPDDTSVDFDEVLAFGFDPETLTANDDGVAQQHLELYFEGDYLREGVTWVIDFEEWEASAGRELNKPNRCENRREIDFSVAPQNWGASASRPDLDGALGTLDYLAYSESDYWSVDLLATCGTTDDWFGSTGRPRVSYSGVFDVTALADCNRADREDALDFVAVPGGWQVTGTVYAKAVQSPGPGDYNDALTHDDTSLVAVSEDIDVTGFRCTHLGDGLVGVFEPMTGQCVCNSGYAEDWEDQFPVCQERASPTCFNADQTTDVWVKDQSVTENGDILMVLAMKISPNSRVDSIVVGSGGFEYCNYPSPSAFAAGQGWRKSFRTSDCTDLFEFVLDTNNILSCGIERFFSDSMVESGTTIAKERDITFTKWIVYQTDISVSVTSWTTIEGAYGPIPVTSESVHNLRTSTVYGTEFLVELGDIEVTADHDLEAILTSQAWDFEQDIAVVEFATLVRWPYEIVSVSVGAFPADSPVNDAPTEVTDTPCTRNDFSDCQQRWRFVITPDTPCTFSGDYGFAVNLGCRDEDVTDDMMTTACVDLGVPEAITIPIIDGDTCLFAGSLVSGLSADLTVYDTQLYTGVSDLSFRLSDTIYVEVAVESDSFPVQGVEVQYALMMLADATSPVPVPMDIARVPTMDANTARFSTYLTSQIAPQLTQYQIEAYTMVVTIRVTYDDGSSKRASTSGHMTPQVTVSLENDPTYVADLQGGDGPGDGSQNGGTASSFLGFVLGGLALLLCAGCAVFVVVRGRGSMDGTKTVATYGVGATKSESSSTASNYYYYQDDEESRPTAGAAGASSASSAASTAAPSSYAAGSDYASSVGYSSSADETSVAGGAGGALVGGGAPPSSVGHDQFVPLNVM